MLSWFPRPYVLLFFSMEAPGFWSFRMMSLALLRYYILNKKYFYKIYCLKYITTRVFLSWFELSSLFFLSLFILRERERIRGGGQREGERGRIPSRLHAVSTEPTQGSISWTMRSWPEPKSKVRHLTDYRLQVPLQEFWYMHTVI